MMGVPTPRIVRLMAQDLIVAGVSGVDAREMMRRVPASLKASMKSCLSIGPWLGTTFSHILRAFCVQMRNALRGPGEVPDEVDVADDSVSAGFASKSAALAKAMEAVPNEIEGTKNDVAQAL